MPWQLISAQDVGGRSEQQDRLAVLHHDTEDIHLAVVADGVGGHGGGSLAAQTVIDVAKRQFATAELIDPEQFLEQLCLDAHLAIRGLDASSTEVSGSTCVFLLLRGREAYWAHVGDSRLYLLRARSVLLQTTDHSVVQLQADSGLTQDGPAVGSNQLYMCLGGNNKVVPDTDACTVLAEDLFMLCSDGLWGQVEIDEVIASITVSGIDLAMAERWVQEAKQAGGSKGDNISLVLAQFTEQPTGGLAALLGRFRRLFSRSDRPD